MAGISDDDESSAPSAMVDPAYWDVQSGNRPTSTIETSVKLIKGYVVPMKKYEFSSCILEFAHECPDKTKRKCERFKRKVELAKMNRPTVTPVLPGFWDEYEDRYRTLIVGKCDEDKYYILASLLLGYVEYEGSDPGFVIWLCERSLIDPAPAYSLFFSHLRPEITEDNKEECMKRTMEVCSWSKELLGAAMEFWRLGESSDLNGNSLAQLQGDAEGAEEGGEIVLDLLSVSRQYEVIRLLDLVEVDKDFEIEELVEEMESIGEPEDQLELLLDWALAHKSAMGCTLAARIIKSWDLPSVSTRLVVFIVNASGKRKKEGKEGGEEEKKLLRSLCRLFTALSYEGLIEREGMEELYEEEKEYWEWRGEEEGLPLSTLLKHLPIIEKEKRREEGFAIKTKKERIFDRLILLMNASLCRSHLEWNQEWSEEEEEDLRETVEEIRALTADEVYSLATGLGDALLGVWRDVGGGGGGGGREGELHLPSRRSLSLLCALMETTVDSSMMGRFVIQALPYLLLLALGGARMGVYAGNVTVWMLARCFQSHLTLNAMGAWPEIRERVTELLASMCPLHWQTRRLAELMEVELPPDCCVLPHPFAMSPPSMQAVQKMLENFLDRKDWSEMRLATVADLVGDVYAELGGPSQMEEWWSERLWREITSGGPSAQSITRLLSLSVYRGVIGVERVREETERRMQGDEHSVLCALSVMNVLLVGSGSHRNEQQLLFEGALEIEEMGGIMRRLVQMGVEHPSPPVRRQCTIMMGKLLKRQYAKRVWRGGEEAIFEEMETKKERSREEVEMYTLLARKCAPTGWDGLPLEKGGGISIIEAGSALNEMEAILWQDHLQKSATQMEAKESGNIDRLARWIIKSTGGDHASACLVHVLLTELREKLMEEGETPCMIYRSLASAIIARFVEILRERKGFPATSSLLVPTLLYAWQDANEKERDDLPSAIYRFLRGWKGGEPAHLTTVLTLALSLMESNEELNPEWTKPMRGLVEKGEMGERRRRHLYHRTIALLAAMEEEEGEGGEKREKEREERLDKYERVERKGRRRRGCKLISRKTLGQNEYMERREEVEGKWRERYQAEVIGSGLAWNMERRKRKLASIS